MRYVPHIILLVKYSLLSRVDQFSFTVIIFLQWLSELKVTSELEKNKLKNRNIHTFPISKLIWLKMWPIYYLINKMPSIELRSPIFIKNDNFPIIILGIENCIRIWKKIKKHNIHVPIYKLIWVKMRLIYYFINKISSNEQCKRFFIQNDNFPVLTFGTDHHHFWLKK